MMEQQQQQHEQTEPQLQLPPLNGYGYDMLEIDAPALTAIPEPTPVITRVAVELIGPIWEQAEPLLRLGATDLPMYDTNDIRLLLMKQAAHLWVQYTDGLVEVCMLTEFAIYPKGVWLRVWLIGARKGSRPDYPAIIASFRQFAALNKCSGIELIGRIGWARKLANIWPECKLCGFAMRETF